MPFGKLFFTFEEQNQFRCVEPDFTSRYTNNFIAQFKALHAIFYKWLLYGY